jgi:phosphoribosylaminoimidazolecarboxamide formyltransferase/IMP cyclohydrolase
MSNALRQMYLEINKDHFPKKMEIALYDDSGRQSLFYEKVEWVIDGESRGLRYGENPDQEAAMYKLVNGNLTIGEVECIKPGQYIMSDVELLQSGKHPGKTNITDIDNALNILRYLTDKPCTVIVKHNNPSGVAVADSLAASYEKAYYADRIAAFGGAIAVNRPLDKATAEQIVASYCEVVAAPEYEPGVLEILAKKKNVRVMRIANIARLQAFAPQRVLDFKSLIDGGLILQQSFSPIVRSAADLIPAETEYQGKKYRVKRAPTKAELDDMVFGWLVEAGVTSNSVLYVKDGVTVGIGTGEQDRVGVAEIAIHKAYKKAADLYAWKKWQTPLALLKDETQVAEAWAHTKATKAGLPGSTMVSDAFFPFRDGVDAGLKEGITAVVQPGGSVRDWEVIEAVNEANAAMMFTGQRSFKH